MKNAAAVICVKKLILILKNDTINFDSFRYVL